MATVNYHLRLSQHVLSRSACMGQVPGEVRRPGELELVH